MIEAEGSRANPVLCAGNVGVGVGGSPLTAEPALAPLKPCEVSEKGHQVCEWRLPALGPG